jgi:hypothetical protein
LVGDLEQYGNIYIDRTTGIKFHIDIVNQSDKTNKLIKELKTKIPEEYLSVSYDKKLTKKDLDAINKSLFDNWKDMNRDGSSIIKTYVDDSQGKVVIVATQITEAEKNHLSNTYGDNISIVVNPNQELVKPAAISAYVNILGGGIGITSNGLSCSTAAIGIKDGIRYIITGGHCLNAPGNDSVMAYQYSGSSELVGTDHYTGFYNGAGVDIGLINNRHQ